MCGRIIVMKRTKWFLAILMTAALTAGSIQGPVFAAQTGQDPIIIEGSDQQEVPDETVETYVSDTIEVSPNAFSDAPSDIPDEVFEDVLETEDNAGLRDSGENSDVQAGGDSSAIRDTEEDSDVQAGGDSSAIQDTEDDFEIQDTEDNFEIQDTVIQDGQGEGDRTEEAALEQDVPEESSAADQGVFSEESGADQSTASDFTPEELAIYQSRLRIWKYGNAMTIAYDSCGDENDPFQAGAAGIAEPLGFSVYSLLTEELLYTGSLQSTAESSMCFATVDFGMFSEGQDGTADDLSVESIPVKVILEDGTEANRRLVQTVTQDIAPVEISEADINEENGTVLSWEPVADAAGYSFYVEVPGEQYTTISLYETEQAEMFLEGISYPDSLVLAAAWKYDGDGIGRIYSGTTAFYLSDYKKENPEGTEETAVLEDSDETADREETAFTENAEGAAEETALTENAEGAAEETDLTENAEGAAEETDLTENTEITEGAAEELTGGLAEEKEPRGLEIPEPAMTEPGVTELAMTEPGMTETSAEEGAANAVSGGQTDPPDEQETGVILSEPSEEMESVEEEALNAAATATASFNGHKYQRFDTSKTWTEARDYCESLGGHLVTITSAEEQSFVADLVSGGTKYAYWLGADKLSGSYRWITGENFTYSNWASGEPNSCSGEFYVQMYLKPNPHTRSYAYQWNNIRIDNTFVNGETDYFQLSYIGFVCEWETRQSIANARVTGVTDKTFTEKVKTNGAGQAVTVTLGNKTLVKNTDYKVTYKNHKEVGTATVVITGIGGYSGTISKTYKIKLAVPTIQSLKSDIHGEFTCTGSSIYGATSYKVYYKNLSTKESGTKENTGRTVTATGLKAGDTYEVRIQAQRKVGSKLLTGKYSEPKNVKIHKASKSITGYTIWISGEKNTNDKYYSYTGSAIKPGIELKKLTKKLRSGVDYKVTYSNNTNQGKATVQIKGIGDYYGTLNATFYIHTFVKKSGKWYYRGGRFEKKAYDLDGPLIVEQAMTVPGGASVTCTKLTANNSVSINTNAGITSQGDVETNQAVELSKKASFTCMGKFTVKSRLTLSENAAISVEKGMSVLTVGYLQMSRGSKIEIKESFVFNPSSSSAPVTNLSAGTIQVEVNAIYKTNKFSATRDHMLSVKNSQKKHKISIARDCVIGTLNLSDADLLKMTIEGEGWPAEYLFKKDETTETNALDNLCKITFPPGSNLTEEEKNLIRGIVFEQLFLWDKGGTDLLEAFYESAEGLAVYSSDSFTIPYVLPSSLKKVTLSGRTNGFGLLKTGSLTYQNGRQHLIPIYPDPFGNGTKQYMSSFMSGLADSSATEIYKTMHDVFVDEFFGILAEDGFALNTASDGLRLQITKACDQVGKYLVQMCKIWELTRKQLK